MYNSYFKRVFDFFLSLIAFTLLIPIFLILIPILKFTGEGEIFFFQERIGLNLEIFKIIKFATMLKDSPNLGNKIYTSENDERILPIGKFLRKTKINETLQLINILYGNMSIVGPRPLIDETFNFYSEEEKSKISSIKPGLTGISSIFFSNEDKLLKNSLDKKDYYRKKIVPIKAYLELYYVKKLSLYLDLKIILCTFLKIIGTSNKKLLYFFPEIKAELINFE